MNRTPQTAQLYVDRPLDWRTKAKRSLDRHNSALQQTRSRVSTKYNRKDCILLLDGNTRKITDT
ncbi:hypothetical protein BRADO6202 [Bradyrhizobium sp. ORS 278]|nr:hypothetical protein BRADO6202 [Bradyrhizobium sp. ORS 278]